MKKFILSLVIGSSLVLSACSSSDDKKPASGQLGPDDSQLGGTCDTSGSQVGDQLSYNGIVNGYKLGAGNPIANRIVGLVFRTGENSSGICTGSLLPGNVVLTAAHCMPTSKKAEDIYVLFTNNLSCLTQNSAPKMLRAVKSLRIHSDYHRDQDTDVDLAMLKFDGFIPAGYQAFDVPGALVDLSVTDKVIMSGFGSTRMGAGDSKVLRITRLGVERMTYDPNQPKSFKIDQHDTGVCAGDSGGPLILYKGGRPQVIGVASAVSNERARSADEACNAYSYYVNLSKQADWISTNYNSLLRGF